MKNKSLFSRENFGVMYPKNDNDENQNSPIDLAFYPLLAKCRKPKLVIFLLDVVSTATIFFPSATSCLSAVHADAGLEGDSS